MKKTCLWTGAALAAVLLSGCKRDSQIQSYSVPTQSPAPASAQTPANSPAPAAPGAQDMNSQPVEVNHSPVHWTTPATWTEVAPTSVRIGNFAIGGPGASKAEVSITSFPGDVGGELANVNRWRRENSMTEISEADIKSETAPVGSTSGKLYDFSGDTTRTVVTVISRDGSSWFFKLRGSPDTVAANKSTFLDFLKSIQFGGDDPHAGLNMASTATTTAPAPSGPMFTVPANWTETAAGPMLLKSFTLTGDAGATATVTVSEFGGVAGGTLPNINRWRHQVGLPDATDADVPQLVQTISAGNDKASVVDFNGTSAETQKPARLIAASIPRGDNTWFFKLVGDTTVVAREKDAFVQFVQSARLP